MAAAHSVCDVRRWFAQASEVCDELRDQNEDIDREDFAQRLMPISS